LFFLQHLYGGGANDENRKMFSVKCKEIVEGMYDPKPIETAEDIRDRIINKSKLLTGG